MEINETNKPVSTVQPCSINEVALEKTMTDVLMRHEIWI
jgi:hypothetical protein